MEISEYLLYVLFICLLLFLYSSSEKFQYYSKFGIYFVSCAAVSIILLPVAMLRPRNVCNLLYLSCIGPIISWIIGIEWVIEGGENISPDKPYVIVANHQSSLDILGMFHIWPLLKKCTAVAKQELMFAWPFGLLLWLSGVLFIPRSKSEKSKKILNEELQIRKKDNVKLWIFPEGTRSGDRQIHKFKKGGFHMAVSAGIPILPIVYSYYSFLDNRNKQFHKGRVTMSVLPAISTEGISLDNIDSLISEVQEKMRNTFESISNDKIDLAQFNSKLSNKIYEENKL